MADATSKSPNPLGLKLETREPDSVEVGLFDVFLTYLPGDSQVSAPVAAARINQILLSNTNNNTLNHDKAESPERAAEDVHIRELEDPSIGGFLHAFWDMYFLLGCQIDPRTEVLDRHVSLVGALKQLPSEVRSEKYGRIWQDLPRMAWFLTERWNRRSSLLSNFGCEFKSEESEKELTTNLQLEINLRDDNKYRLDAGQEWYNMNALLARLTTEGLLEGLLSALQSIVEGMECLDKRDSQFLFRYSIPAAALWLSSRTLAAKLLEACYQGECSDSNSGGYLWEKEQRSENDLGRGYSLRRWNFWQHRLEALSKHRDADEHSKEICRNALETMNAVESERIE